MTGVAASRHSRTIQNGPNANKMDAGTVRLTLLGPSSLTLLHVDGDLLPVKTDPDEAWREELRERANPDPHM